MYPISKEPKAENVHIASVISIETFLSIRNSYYGMCPEGALTCEGDLTHNAIVYCRQIGATLLIYWLEIVLLLFMLLLFIGGLLAPHCAPLCSHCALRSAQPHRLSHQDRLRNSGTNWSHV